MSGPEHPSQRAEVPIEAIYKDLQQRIRFPPPHLMPVNVLDWSEERLRENALPPRPPTELEGAARIWEEAVRNLNLVDTPSVRVFQIDGTGRHRHRQRTTDRSSNNWSGGVLSIPNSWICKTIYASWIVPSAKPGVPQAPALKDFTWQGSCWLGLDGNLPGSVAMPQMGTKHLLHRPVLGPATSAATVWWQWWIKNDPFNIPLTIPIPVCPGHRVTALETVLDEFSVNFFISNLTTGKSVSFNAMAPKDSSGAAVPIEQQTMEWIVERQTEIGGSDLLPFADYERCTFKSCVATLLNAAGKNVTIDLATPKTLRMVNWGDPVDPGHVISTYAGGDFETVDVTYEP